MPRQLNDSYEDLVKKAQLLFWVKGFKPVRNDELAEHLGVSVSTIYNKYSKDMLYLDALEDYVYNWSDPVLTKLRESKNGLQSLKDFFYGLIDALLDGTFPKSCLIVNTVVEMQKDNERLIELYELYFNNMVRSYRIVLDDAIEKGEIKYPDRKEEYAEFLIGVIFSLSIFYKVKNINELKEYIDFQLSCIE